MADDWYYAQSNERKGPVTFAKLQAMAKNGWLTPDDLVWTRGMLSWQTARETEGLFETAIGKLLRSTIPGVRVGMETERSPEDVPKAPPGLPEKQPAPPRRKPRQRTDTAAFDWDELKPRHVIAACGGFLAALGIIFTVIAESRLSLAFTLGGIFIATAGLYVEIGRLLGQAIENIGKASKEAADRRLRSKELALEKQRLDLEASRLAQDKAARMAPPVPPAVLANQQADLLPTGPAGTGPMVVINQPPVQRWSPGLAAVLSFFLPGLGQLYKGQVINGLVWFFMVMCGYAALILPGLILHFFCVLGALSGNPWTEGKTMVVRE